MHNHRESTVGVTKLAEVCRLAREHNAVRLHFVAGEVDGEVRKLVGIIQPRDVSQAMQDRYRVCVQYLAVSSGFIRGMVRGSSSLFRFSDDMPQC